MNNDWDKKDDVLREFPEYVHIPVPNPDVGRVIVSQIAMKLGKPIFGQARWFSEESGVLILKKETIAELEAVQAAEKKRREERRDKIIRRTVVVVAALLMMLMALCLVYLSTQTLRHNG